MDTRIGAVGEEREPEVSDEPSRRPVRTHPDLPPGVLGAVLLANLAVDAVVLAASSTPDGFAGLPKWMFVVLGAASLAVLLWRPTRTARFGIPFAVLAVVLGAITTALVSIDSLSEPSVPAFLQSRPPAAASQRAQEALRGATASGTCVVVRDDPTGLLPTPYQRCAYLSPSQVDYIVNWTNYAGTQPWQALIFSPAGTDPAVSDTCERHLGGPWWADMNEGDPVQPCAALFRFVPAP
jgi:hypothetical protein